MKLRMTIMVLAILGGLFCSAVASAQSSNPKFNTKRTSLQKSSYRPTASGQATVQPVGHLSGGHATTVGCGCETAPSCGCDVAPSCGCDVAPSCGCDVAPSCGCDVAPSCGCDTGCGGASRYCGGRSCCPPLIPALMHGIGSVLDALIPCHGGCGYSCPVYPVGPCNSHPRRIGLFAKLGSHCGCDACGSGCHSEPSCGCNNGPMYSSPIDNGPVFNGKAMPLNDPFQDDAEMLAPPAPPSEARRQRTSTYPYYARQNSPSRRVATPSLTARPDSLSVIKRTSHEGRNAAAAAGSTQPATPVDVPAANFVRESGQGASVPSVQRNEVTPVVDSELFAPIPPRQVVPAAALRTLPVNPLRATSSSKFSG